MTMTKTPDPLSKARAAAQELHAALSDAATKQGGAVKADLEAVQQKTRALMDSLKTSVNAQQEAARKHLKEAIAKLDTAQKHAMEGAKSFGQAFEASVRKTVADARASAQHISEALAEERSANARKTGK
ncbi:MAG TPA: hypothetical protein VMH40_14210 [Myxococcaceae bacterium]|nr:hypothetical protein [Myxococcaceae bacterium]